MRYTKKMILVDFDENPNLRPAAGDVFELTAALKNPRPSVLTHSEEEPTELTSFNRAISSVLQNDKLNDDDKMKYYNDLLRRYMLAKKTATEDRRKQNTELLRTALEGVNKTQKRPRSPPNEISSPQIEMGSPPKEMGPPQPIRKKPKKAVASRSRPSAESSDSSWSTDAIRRNIKKKLIIQPLIKQIFPNHIFSDEDDDDDGDDTEVNSAGSQFRTPKQSDDDDYDPPSLFGVPRRIRGNGYISRWEVLK